MPDRLLSLVRSLSDSYSEILFLQRAWPGALMLAATFTVPSVGTAGLVSVAAAYAFASFIGMGAAFLATGFFTYNALLTGLGIGSLFQITPLSLLLAATAGVMSLNLSLMLNSLFRQFLQLPILSLPFVVISMVVYLASLGYSNLLVREDAELLVAWAPQDLPTIIDGFLRALGAILFLPYPLTGLVFALLLLLYSRILFLLAILGYLVGTSLVVLMQGAPDSVYLDPNNFNFILIAMALGGVFLVPSRRSLAIAAVGVMLAALLMSAVKLFWALYGLPAFTLPFNLVTLSLLYVLILVGFPAVADRIGATPEDTLDDHLNRRHRFPLEPKRIVLPFSGEWTVWQGFDGRWTHQGLQTHALDFLIQRNDSSFRGDGLTLSDYHAWNKPVLSPVRGRVAMVHDGVPDNAPGKLNERDNWGNWVSIDTGAGWHVIIAHFAQNSLQVKAGDWVEPGTRLGLCGNSGYSPQPHIHLHVQVGAMPGEATLPFLVQNYRKSDGCFVPAAVPAEGDRIAPLHPDDHLLTATALILDSRWRLENQAGETRELHVRMNAAGETCLDSGRAQLFFHRDNGQFYFYRLEGHDPLLAALFRYLPRLPLGHQPGLWWKDVLPMAVHENRASRHLFNLARLLAPELGRIDYQARFVGRREIEGETSDRQGARESFRILLAEGQGLLQRIETNGKTLHMHPLHPAPGDPNTTITAPRETPP